MRTILLQFLYLLQNRTVLTMLFIINFLGTIYGYIWYAPQLSRTEPQFLLFVPDSPTASLFFCFAILGWLLGKNFKLMEALALITLMKYGIWAVVMNILTLAETGSIGILGWMLVVSHFMMAVEGILYMANYRFTLVHIAIASVWTLHNDVIDYVYGQMPTYSSLYKYADHIGYFTFWLSIACISIAYYSFKKRNYLNIVQ
ncbi:lipoprotein heptaprenylglyceryl N-acetyltransferase LhaT [Ureibacillus terrenus]|uniref:DUF1405 domain-containing protein n=1 Tax=Ureibacillus terrenus TaxID=118246 RepID=A0A540V6G9_9BACL|nr:DUF1405 domain-containing protein [Ureibacillus terrenus]MED3660644.1 DUF1405 domain-containing protein [Ureibacillus terrenus]MED3762764.1 DUF1405 domain-containing protein [Ureibacillus terrenus]TQE92364.1 DUF1405 domain-containing protein [Ureibacillus terrenus]